MDGETFMKIKDPPGSVRLPGGEKGKKQLRQMRKPPEKKGIETENEEIIRRLKKLEKKINNINAVTGEILAVLKHQSQPNIEELKSFAKNLNETVSKVMESDNK